METDAVSHDVFFSVLCVQSVLLKKRARLHSRGVCTLQKAWSEHVVSVCVCVCEVYVPINVVIVETANLYGSLLIYYCYMWTHKHNVSHYVLHMN